MNVHTVNCYLCGDVELNAWCIFQPWTHKRGQRSTLEGWVDGEESVKPAWRATQEVKIEDVAGWGMLQLSLKAEGWEIGISENTLVHANWKTCTHIHQQTHSFLSLWNKCLRFSQGAVSRKPTLSFALVMQMILCVSYEEQGILGPIHLFVINNCILLLTHYPLPSSCWQVRVEIAWTSDWHLWECVHINSRLGM